MLNTDFRKKQPRRQYQPRHSNLVRRAVVIVAALAVSVGLSHLGITVAVADGAQVIASIALNTTVPVGAGSRLNFNVQLTCVELTGDNPSCDDVKVTIPIPADTGIAGAASPKDWPFISVGVLSGENQLVSTAQKSADGNAWEITLDRSLRAGESARILFYLTPPAGYTPNQTTFQLSGTVTSTDTSGAEYSTSLGTSAPVVLTAAPVCTVNPAGTQSAIQVSTDRRLAFVITTGNTAIGSLAVDPTTVADSKVTITLPSEYTFVSVTDQNGSPLSYTGSYPGPLVFAMPSLGTLTANPQIVFTLTAPATATSTASVTATVSYTGIGNTTPTTCTAAPVLPVTGANPFGIALGKSATGIYAGVFGNAVVGTIGSSLNQVNYARADRGPAVLPLITDTSIASATSLWSLSINRRTVAIQNIHYYDGLPCLTQGSGTLSDPYLSLPEGTLCTNPAFRVVQLRATQGALPVRVFDNLKITVYYTDGTTDQASFGATPYWAVPADKIVSAVLWEGDYPATSDFSQISLQLLGWPVASLSMSPTTYMVNRAFLTPQGGSTNYPSATIQVGMQVGPDYAKLQNQAHTTTYNYSPGWTGSQSYATGYFNAISSLDGYQDVRRLAVVFPAGSGINVTGVNYPAPLTSQVVADYDGNGSSVYLADLSNLPASGQPTTFAVTFGGMPPGTYTYWTYSGFIGLDPTDAGASCTADGNELVVDLTGIIGPVGEPTTLCKAKQVITVQGSSGGLSIVKTVANISDGSPLLGAPAKVSAKAGDLVQFDLQVSNTSYLPLTDVTIYDVLPHSGDTGISSMLNGFDRGSTFTPQLTGIDVPSGWTAEFSTSFNPCRPELGIAIDCDPDLDESAWQTEMPTGDDEGDLPGTIRLSIGTLAPHEVANVTLSYQLPDDVTEHLDRVAWNNIAGVASLLGRPVLMTETPRVGFDLPTPAVDPDPDPDPNPEPEEPGEPSPATPEKPAPKIADDASLARTGSDDFGVSLGVAGAMLIAASLFMSVSGRRRQQRFSRAVSASSGRQD